MSFQTRLSSTEKIIQRFLENYFQKWPFLGLVSNTNNIHSADQNLSATSNNASKIESELQVIFLLHLLSKLPFSKLQQQCFFNFYNKILSCQKKLRAGGPGETHLLEFVHTLLMKSPNSFPCFLYNIYSTLVPTRLSSESNLHFRLLLHIDFVNFDGLKHLDVIQLKSAKPPQHLREVAPHKAEAGPSSLQLLACYLISLPHEVPAKVQVISCQHVRSINYQHVFNAH